MLCLFARSETVNRLVKVRSTVAVRHTCVVTLVPVDGYTRTRAFRHVVKDKSDKPDSLWLLMLQ